MATLNLPPEERFTSENIFLPLCVRTSVYSRHGLARIRNGVDQDGVKHDEPCLADDVNNLGREGRWAQIPDDVNGGMEWIRLRAWSLMGAMDHLGAQTATVHTTCPKAHHLCRVCDYDAQSPMAAQPYSFMRQCHHADKTARPAFRRRSWISVKEILVRLRKGVSATEAKRLKHTHGIARLFGAIDPDYLDDADPVDYLPQDILHVFPDGLLRSEGAWLFYIFIHMGLDMDAVNRRIRAFHGWPPDVHIPLLKGSKLKKGKRGGKPKSSHTLSMTGSEAMWFALKRCTHLALNARVLRTCTLIAQLTSLASQRGAARAAADRRHACTSCMGIMGKALRALQCLCAARATRG